MIGVKTIDSLILAATAIIIGAPFQFGYGVGVMNLLEGDMLKVFVAQGTSIDMTWDLAWSLTTGLWCIGGMVGAIIGGPMATRLGRKMPLLLNNAFLLTGAFLQVWIDLFVLELTDFRQYHYRVTVIRTITC